METLCNASNNFLQTNTNYEEKSLSLTDAIYDYLADYLGVSSKQDITKSDLTKYLNDLLTLSTDNESDKELIGALTNIIETK